MIDYDIEKGLFRIGVHNFVAKVGETYPMPGYLFEALSFIDDLAESADGGIYRLPPDTSTRVVTITGNVACIEKPIDGNAIFLCHRGKTGRIEIHSLDKNSEEVIYGNGDTVVWIGGKDGAEILNLSIPPFGDGEGIENAVEIDSKSLPDEFWVNFHTLIKAR